ncbi:MAG TPA: ATP synthase F0 subunit B [Steroidobacteraceae bacterium]|nr:ATP synthase F0 subunit B [Steroidobacteraceae bacterium]
MRLDTWTIALQTVNFAILVWLLQRFLFKPVLRMIDARNAELQAHVDQAKALEDKAKIELAALASQREGIEGEREALLKAAAVQAQQAADARRAAAERDAQALLESSRKTLLLERAQALEEARGIAVDLGGEFARRLLAQVPMPLRAEGWIEQIESHFRSLPQSEREALSRESDRGLTVVTAGPLPQAMLETWRTRLQRLLGRPAAISFEENAGLIAGAELHFPTTMLRISWQGALADMRSEVSAHADGR